MTELKKTATAIKTTIETNGDLALTFSNGMVLALNPNRLSKEIQLAAMMHGLKQKLVDAGALSRNPDTGRSATIDDKYNAVLEVFSRITKADGTWNKVATADGETGSGNSGLLFRALVRMYPKKTEGQIKSYLETLDKTQQATLRGSDRVKPIIEEIKAEDQVKKGKGKGMGDDLLAGLEEEEEANGNEGFEEEEAPM